MGPIKRLPCQQADGIILKHREMLVSQRIQAIALRGNAMEFGMVTTKGIVEVAALLEKLAADSAIPGTARAMFEQMSAQTRRAVRIRAGSLGLKLSGSKPAKREQ
jgi:hypothetical protein